MPQAFPLLEAHRRTLSEEDTFAESEKVRVKNRHANAQEHSYARSFLLHPIRVITSKSGISLIDSNANARRIALRSADLPHPPAELLTPK